MSGRDEREREIEERSRPGKTFEVNSSEIQQRGLDIHYLQARLTEARKAIQVLTDVLAETSSREDALKAVLAERDATIRRVKALIARWRAEGARCDSFHATMGTGYHVCADDLDAALQPEGKQL